MKRVSQLFGLPLLYTLPQELVEIIRRYSQHSLLWRCVPVFQLAAHISTTAPAPLLTLPLSDLHSWERNGTLQRVTSATQSSLLTLRLTVDSHGINKVERLINRPQYTGERTSQSAFIIVPGDSDSRAVAQLKARPAAPQFISVALIVIVTGRMFASRIFRPAPFSVVEHSRTTESRPLPGVSWR